MSKRQYPLTASQPSQIVGLQWEAGLALIYNPTGSPVLLRVGSPEIPNSQNADYIVPANSALTIAVVGHEFGVTFADSTLLSTLTTGNLASRALIQFQTADEPVPQFGAASFQSLSTSEVFPLTGFNGTRQLPIIDLGAWGGALIYICPTGGSGQGVVQINTSDDGVSFGTTPIGTFSFWPSVPAFIQVPRAGRYLSIFVNNTAFVGEPAIQYTIGVRTTLAEIQDLVYNTSAQPITKALNLPGISAQQFSFVTIGLPAISIAAIATSGTTSGAALQFLVEASADNLNWRQVTAREQVMSQGITLYRSVGQLDFFTRISFFQEVAGQTLIGSAYFSVPPLADLAYILNTIQQSLGDRNASSNTNQDIYHELDTIRLAIAGIKLGTDHLANIDAIESTYLPSINTSDAAISTNTANIRADTTNIATSTSQTVTNTSTMTTQLGTLHSDIGTTNTNTANTNTNAASINTGVSTLNATASGMKTDLDNMNTALSRGSNQPLALAGNVVANIWTIFSGITPGQFITAAMAGTFTAGASNGQTVQIAVGTGAAAQLVFYTGVVEQQLAGSRGAAPMMKYDSLRSAGYQIPAGMNTLWVISDFAATVYINVAITP